jgi:hypothetical protein
VVSAVGSAPRASAVCVAASSAAKAAIAAASARACESSSASSWRAWSASAAPSACQRRSARVWIARLGRGIDGVHGGFVRSEAEHGALEGGGLLGHVDGRVEAGLGVGVEGLGSRQRVGESFLVDVAYREARGCRLVWFPVEGLEDRGLEIDPARVVDGAGHA